MRSSFVKSFDVGNGPQMSEWIRSSLRETLLSDGRNGLRVCFARIQMTDHDTLSRIVGRFDVGKFAKRSN